MTDAPIGLEPLLAEARERWTRCDEAEQKQRESILAAKKFRAGDQWPEAIRIQREGGQAIQGQAAQPPRPCLTIDRISQPVRQASNQIKQAHFGINVLPVGHGADDETAEIFKGYIKRVQNLARAEAPIEWAADQAIEGGLGWFRLLTEYVRHDLDRVTASAPTDISFFDQELRLGKVKNNLTVYCDPHAQKPTGFNPEYLFVIEDMGRDEFRRRWPKSKEVGVDDLAGTGNLKNWASEDTIRIAEYWRIEYESQTICLLKDGSVVPFEKTTNNEAIVRKRVVDVPKVKWSKINAVAVLEREDGTKEEGEWVGSKIPFIPVEGEALDVDGITILRGMIQSAMDPQRMVNYQYSAATEASALAPKSPLIVAEGQFEAYKDIWQNANRFNYAFLPYTPVSLAGSAVPPPQRESAEPAIQAMVELLHLSEEAIKATTSFFDASLGAGNQSQKSGRLALALQKQTELATSNFGENVMRALIYAGEQMIEIIPKITRPGQILHILGEDDEPEQVMVGQPFKANPQGIPEPVQATPEQIKLEKGLAQFYDLSKGRYAVTVSIGKAATTMREEGVAAVGELLPNLPPPMAAAVAPEWVAELSFPGAQRLAEVMRKTLPPELQQNDDGQPNPAMLQQENAQLKQALAQIQPLADKNIADIEKVKVQQAGESERLQLDLASKERIAAMNNEVKVAVEELKLGMDDFQTRIQHMEALIGHAHEKEMQAREHAQERRMGTLQHQQNLEQGVQQHNQVVLQNQQGHDQALEQGEMQHANTLEQQAAEPQTGAGA